MPDRLEVERLLRELYAARLGGDLEALCRTFAKDSRLDIAGTSYSTPMAIRAAGLGEIRSWLALLVKTFQLSDQEILSMIIDGEAAAVHWRARSRSSAAGRLSERSLWGADGSVALGDLAWGSSLGARLEELAGRCVLVATADQLTAALALIELDGIARRLILSPPDLPTEHLPFVITAAAVDAVVSDRPALEAGTPGAASFVSCSLKVAPAAFERTERYQTEWILLTSGT